jgi:hypothetical protein
MKCYEHVTVINHDFKREFYTRHGLHLNNLGKDCLSKSIASIYSTTLHKEIRSIHLSWKEKYNHSDNKGKDDQYAVNQIKDSICKSNRVTKSMKLRSDDFLW